MEGTITGSVIPHILQINAEGNEMLVCIHPDGTIEYGENYTPNRAAQTFWKAMGHYAPAVDPAPVVLTPEEAYDKAMNIIG